jgi:hypothetical protein
MHREEKELYPFSAGPKKQIGRENIYRSGRQVGSIEGNSCFDRKPPAPLYRE